MPDTFTIRPFAFMRLTHEAVRAGAAEALELAASLAADPSMETFAQLEAVYAQTRRGIEIHAKLEEGAFFPLLDERFDRVCTREGLADEHADDDLRDTAIHAALGAFRDAPTRGNAATVHSRFADWEGETERHLKHEEDVMMPLTMKVADSPQGRARAVRAIIDVAWDEVVEELCPWVAQSLEKTKPFGPLRMFTSAVMVTHDPSERDRLSAPLRRALSASSVDRLTSVGAFTATV